MRRNFYKHYFVLIIYSFLFTSSMLLGSESDFNRIEKYFKNVPADIQTSIYWYWINDNLSKEAVIKDLHSMKEKGINRAFIGKDVYKRQELCKEDGNKLLVSFREGYLE